MNEPTDPVMQVELQAAREEMFDLSLSVTYAFAALLHHLHERHLIDPLACAKNLREIGHAVRDARNDEQAFVPLHIAGYCDDLAHPPEGADGNPRPSWFRGVVDGGKT